MKRRTKMLVEKSSTHLSSPLGLLAMVECRNKIVSPPEKKNRSARLSVAAGMGSLVDAVDDRGQRQPRCASPLLNATGVMGKSRYLHKRGKLMTWLTLEFETPSELYLLLFRGADEWLEVG